MPLPQNGAPPAGVPPVPQPPPYPMHQMPRQYPPVPPNYYGNNYMYPYPPYYPPPPPMHPYYMMNQQPPTGQSLSQTHLPTTNESFQINQISAYRSETDVNQKQQKVEIVQKEKEDSSKSKDENQDNFSKKVTGLSEYQQSSTKINIPLIKSITKEKEKDSGIFDENSDSKNISEVEEEDSDWKGNDRKRNQEINNTPQQNQTSRISDSKMLSRISQKKIKQMKQLSEIKCLDDWSEQEQRYMKSTDQVKILESEFSKDPHWTKEKMRKLSEFLNLKESQVYKWNWDRRQMQDKYLMKRIENKDLPDNLFKVMKKGDDKESEENTVENDSASKGGGGYFKVLKLGNFKKI